MVSLDDFKTIGLEDKPVFDAHTRQYPVMHSGELFSTMVCWSGYVQYRWLMRKNNLLIVSQTPELTVVHPPSGPFDRTLLEEVLSFAQQQDAVLGYIKETEKQLLSTQFPDLVFVENRDFFDYVYLASELADLPGTKYGKIRNRLNKFTKTHTYTVEDLSKENMDEAMEFLHRWCLWKDCDANEILTHEKNAIMYAMAHCFELGLHGLVLRINGALEALAVYEQMNADTVVVHFEKGAPEYDGVYKAVNKETAQRVRHQVRFIDREEDLGVPGLRQAKLSYQPHHFVKVFYTEKESMRATGKHR
ncbi:MAG: DUF2156 domain-containing protein [Candidatus Thermoplasmatota archaeon]|nr:DUF2156 domain-containing protein [Candidatus Thermoplasmatota archaeon]